MVALNINNSEVERLAKEVAELTGESQTEAVRKALEERQARLSSRVAQSKGERWLAFLEQEVWPTMPERELGRQLSKEEELLGYGDEGL